MKAALFTEANSPLTLGEIDSPCVLPEQIRIRVEACAVCRTDIHLIDGDLPEPKRPLVLGHEIVGIVEEKGSSVSRFELGDRVGVPWLASTCMSCSFCNAGEENLCDQALFTGYTVDGGFAEYTVADARFCFGIPPTFDPARAAPLLCAGLIGWRSMRMAGSAEKVGIYGFGAAAHVITPIASRMGKKIFAFTSPGDVEKQAFARSTGAVWAGGSDEKAPELLDAVLIFAPVGDLVPTSLSAVRKGGSVICGGIHMTAIPSFPYSLLWGERSIKSVANLTRADGEEFLSLVSKHPPQTQISEFGLADINAAIASLRSGKVNGAAVIRI